MRAVAKETGTKDISRVALKLFFNIAEEWGLNNSQQRVLLGNPSSSSFFNWKSDKSAKLSQDVLERISHIQNIYKILRIIFPTHEQAIQWPAKANSAFNGATALEIMLNGSIVDLNRVHAYLNGVRGW